MPKPAKKIWDKRTLEWRRHSTYSIWNNMLMRCYNEKHHGFKDYGQRGIVVCERWLPMPWGIITRKEAHTNFIADMGLRPNQWHSLDRRESNGPYSKDNCRWEKPRVQAQNKRDSVWLDDPLNEGQKIAAAELARRMGLTYQALRHRLLRENKWPIT